MTSIRKSVLVGVGLLAAAHAACGKGTTPAERTAPTPTSRPIATTAPTTQPSPYVDLVGTVHGAQILGGEAEGAGGLDLSFSLRLDGEGGAWFVISRSSTPFMRFRLGPTYIGLSKQRLADGTRVRVVGVKKVDRIPPTFHHKKLPAGRTVTAFIVTVFDKAGETPVYVNNWFHPWRGKLEGILDPEIARYYVGKTGPYWVCGWLPRIEQAKLLLDEATFKELVKRPLTKSAYRGYLVKAPDSKLGYKLKVSQLWQRNPKTGAYELRMGTDRGVEVLRRPSRRVSGHRGAPSGPK